MGRPPLLPRACPKQALEIAHDKDWMPAMARELGILYLRSVSASKAAGQQLVTTNVALKSAPQP